MVFWPTLHLTIDRSPVGIELWTSANERLMCWPTEKVQAGGSLAHTRVLEIEIEFVED